MLINELIVVELDSMNEVHERELLLLNKLYKSILDKDLENITIDFDIFIEDLKLHFDSEEKLMQKYKFHAFLKHKMAHMNAVVEIRKARTDWEKNKEPEILQQYFEEAFKPWLIRHLNWMDTVTAKFLKEEIEKENS